MGEGKNGLPGAFWFDLDKILATITKDDLKRKLQAFEQAQQDEAIAAALQRKRRPPRRRKADIMISGVI